MSITHSGKWELLYVKTVASVTTSRVQDQHI
jgi:hypothetical protein